MDPTTLRIESRFISIAELLRTARNPGSEGWSREAKSRFIESIAIRVPIGQFWLYSSDNLLEIFDGRKRWGAIEEFVSNQFALTGLEFDFPLSDKQRWEDLKPKIRRRILETEVPVHLLQIPGDGKPTPECLAIARRIQC
jgi:hypothetical protein